MTWLRGVRCTDPEAMPEKEARPPTQNRHGGAPRGERVPLDARRCLARRGPSRAETRDNRNSAPFGAPLAPHGVDGKETSKTRPQQRAAGTKKTALFDMVNRNIAATRSGPAERAKRRAVTTTLSCPGQARASAPILRTASIRAREPGPRGHTTSCGKPILRFALIALGPRKSGSPDLRAFKRRSRASPRSVSRSASLHSPGTRERRGRS